MQQVNLETQWNSTLLEKRPHEKHVDINTKILLQSQAHILLEWHDLSAAFWSTATMKQYGVLPLYPTTKLQIPKHFQEQQHSNQHSSWDSSLRRQPW